MENRKMDLRGQICPSSLLSSLREVNIHKESIKSGALFLTILTDNRDSTITIPESLTRMGYEVRVVKEQDYYKIDICASKF